VTAVSAVEERVRVVKACPDEVVAVVRDADSRRHLVVVAAGVERCSSCPRQPCEHLLAVKATRQGGRP